MGRNKEGKEKRRTSEKVFLAGQRAKSFGNVTMQMVQATSEKKKKKNHHPVDRSTEASTTLQTQPHATGAQHQRMVALLFFDNGRGIGTVWQL